MADEAPKDLQVLKRATLLGDEMVPETVEVLDVTSNLEAGRDRSSSSLRLRHSSGSPENPQALH